MKRSLLYWLALVGEGGGSIPWLAPFFFTWPACSLDRWRWPLAYARRLAWTRTRGRVRYRGREAVSLILAGGRLGDARPRWEGKGSPVDAF